MEFTRLSLSERSEWDERHGRWVRITTWEANAFHLVLGDRSPENDDLVTFTDGCLTVNS